MDSGLRPPDGVIARQDCYEVGGGESGYISPDPRDPEIVYAGSEGAIIDRYNHRTNQHQDVSPYPLDTSGNGADALKYRLQWTEPLFVSTYDSNVIYTAAQNVLKSTDKGHSWSAISPDLTRNDKVNRNRRAATLRSISRASSITTPSSRCPNRRCRRVCYGPEPTTV